MAVAAPFKARQGMMLEKKKRSQSNYVYWLGKSTYLVHRDPQEYTRTSFVPQYARKSGLGEGLISFPYAFI